MYVEVAALSLFGRLMLLKNVTASGYDLIFFSALQVLVKAIPIKQGHKLRIVWPITPEIHHYKEGPCRYLGHLIGHEGEGSLYYVLKTLGAFLYILTQIFGRSRVICT